MSHLWHKHPHVKSGQRLSLADRAADRARNGLGSWTYLIWQTIIVAGWIALNLTAYIQHWDPYPFILLNLAFSTQAAYAAPLILLSQKRQDAQASQVAVGDYITDRITQELLVVIAQRIGILDEDIAELIQTVKDKHDA